MATHSSFYLWFDRQSCVLGKHFGLCHLYTKFDSVFHIAPKHMSRILCSCILNMHSAAELSFYFSRGLLRYTPSEPCQATNLLDSWNNSSLSEYLRIHSSPKQSDPHYLLNPLFRLMVVYSVLKDHIED